MKSYLNFLIVFIFAVAIIAQEKDLSGVWSGKLELPNTMKLTVVFNISINSDGTYTSTLDSPDQGAKGIPTESTKVEGDSITISIPAIRGAYKGKIVFEEMKIEGKWSQGGMNLDLTVNKVDKVEEVKRPQEPKEPFPYNAEEVLFENEKDNVTLAGTLTFPKEGNNFPAVVLISGSGGQNRNEELLNHKPFLVIADYLTRNGIAVLRFDDRGIAESTGNHELATTEDFAKDVLAAVEFLKERKEIDKNKIGLIGHSEGGLISPIAAINSSDVAFIIMMAGPGIPGDSILILQSELIQRAEGSSEEEIQKSLATQRKIYSAIKEINDEKLLTESLDKIFIDEFAKMTEEEKSKLGDPEAYKNMQMKILTSAWFRNFVKYNPASTLEKVKCPVLAINGENDLQVPPKENLTAIETALKKAGNKNFETKLLPGLNHLFQTSSTGKVSEYGQIEETFSPLALETILDWIKKITK